MYSLRLVWLQGDINVADSLAQAYKGEKIHTLWVDHGGEWNMQWGGQMAEDHKYILEANLQQSKGSCILKNLYIIDPVQLF